jgi:hypothetical protein
MGELAAGRDLEQQLVNLVVGHVDEIEDLARLRIAPHVPGRPAAGHGGAVVVTGPGRVLVPGGGRGHQRTFVSSWW